MQQGNFTLSRIHFTWRVLAGRPVHSQSQHWQNPKLPALPSVVQGDLSPRGSTPPSHRRWSRDNSDPRRFLPPLQARASGIEQEPQQRRWTRNAKSIKMKLPLWHKPTNVGQNSHISPKHDNYLPNRTE